MAQLEHTDAPVKLNVPSKHGEHDAETSLAEKNPAEQELHEDDPLAENVPFKQLAQEPVAVRANLPESQLVQEAMSPVPALNFPPEQDEQDAVPPELY